MSSSQYDTYVRSEWDMFVHDPKRACASLSAVEHVQVSRVLDVGCGAGQELLPFVTERQALGVGIDSAPETGRVGRQMFTSISRATRVQFLRARAEAVPLRSASFDVVVCRLALPYMNNRRALSEMARVLRPGGVLLLKIHHALFYLDKYRQSVRTRTLKPAWYATRVLIVGVLYHLSGIQVNSRLLREETFQTKWLLRRELTRTGLKIIGEMPDSKPRAPAFVIVKECPKEE
jgi:ubiquinone/menaquinone biosynthesis C-methylase UbiE